VKIYISPQFKGEVIGDGSKRYYRGGISTDLHPGDYAKIKKIANPEITIPISIRGGESH